MNAKEQLGTVIKQANEDYWAEGTIHEFSHERFIADRIESAGLLAPEWVSVKERLPKIGEDVLVWCGWRMTAIWNGKEWTDEQGVNTIFHVTHWQPLPAPPKENKYD